MLGIKETLVLHFDDREAIILSEITSNSLPSPVVSWKSGSVGGDKGMRREDAPSFVSKVGSNTRSIFSSKMCKTWLKCLYFRCGCSMKNTAKNPTNKDGVVESRFTQALLPCLFQRKLSAMHL